MRRMKKRMIFLIFLNALLKAGRFHPADKKNRFSLANRWKYAHKILVKFPSKTLKSIAGKEIG